MKTVVIAEKPSVARDLAAALGEGNLKRREGALVGGTVAFTWCLGHLCELVPPETYRPEWKRWRLEHLPMVPEELDFRTAPRDTGAKRQLKVLRELTKDADEVVNACDAGREGELIFWWAMRANGWGKGLAPGVPGKGRVSRLWLASMTEGAIREAWEKRRPIGEYGSLAAAAAARAEADWLLGLNLTRAATLVLPREKGDPVWPIGRVQTPVLAAVVRRDLAIERFEPQPFWRVEIGFAGEGTPYTALLDAGDGEALGEKAEQFASRESAAERLAAVRAHAAPWEVLDEAKERQEKAPALFSLTALQREAAKRCGWSAKETLGLAQSLYEKGLVTYPRTEASCLPDDYREKADDVARAVAARLEVGEWALPSECPHAARVFNSAKVSDHFAIIPTDKPIAEASFAKANEERLWQLVAQRFLLAFAPDAVALQTRRTLTAGELAARAKGKVYRKEGWRSLAASFGLLEDKAAAVLPALSEPHDTAIEAELKNGQTKPPAAFNEASLLGLMERIASVLEDEAASDEELKKLRAAIGERGLGTPATRAEILEGLIRRELMERTKAKGAGKLTATSRGRALIAALDERGAEALTLPLKTAQWEESLQAVERGQRDRLSFLQEIEADVRALAALVVGDATDSTALELACPKTGEPVREEGSFFIFPGWPTLKCWKTIAKRPMSAEDYCAILTAHREGEPGEKLTGFVSNKGKPFAARLRLEGERFAFKFD